MARTKRLFVDGTYGQIHVRKACPDKASKRPLVCTHMFPQSGRIFERFVECASEDRVVIAPDFPGHGESEAPSEPISAEDYARSIWEVVDALALLSSHGQVDLFGIHAGAKLAVEVAHQRPGEIKKIVLSSAAILHPHEIDELKKAFKPIPLDDDGTRMRHLWSLLVRNRHKNVTLEMCAAAFAEILRGGEKYEWGHHAVFEYNRKFPDIVQALPHPVALFNPKDELYVMTRRTLDYLQNVTLFDLPDWGHGYLEANADCVTKMVHEWLDS